MLIYTTDDRRVKIDIRLENETLWMTQADMSRLFQTTPQNITIHLKNIYAEGELREEATCKEFLQVRREGDRTVRRKMTFYNLDAVISVGYRVKSLIATCFRIWATERLDVLRHGLDQDLIMLRPTIQSDMQWKILLPSAEEKNWGSPRTEHRPVVPR